MHGLVFAFCPWIIKTKFVNLIFWLNGFLLVLIRRFWEKGVGGGLVALQSFGYLKRQLELIIFTSDFISKKYTWLANQLT